MLVVMWPSADCQLVTDVRARKLRSADTRSLERSLSTGPAAVSATGRSLLLRLEYGTVCRMT